MVAPELTSLALTVSAPLSIPSQTHLFGIDGFCPFEHTVYTRIDDRYDAALYLRSLLDIVTDFVYPPFVHVL